MATIAQGATTGVSGVSPLAALIEDALGSPADPEALSLSIADPDGDELAGFPVTIGSLTHDGLGQYSYAWAVAADAQLGTYTATWTGTLSGDAIEGYELWLVVAPGAVAAPGAYATVSDFGATFDTAPPAAKYTRIVDVLQEASSMLDSEIGFDFYKHPDDGTTEARIYDAPRTRRRLCVHEGIVSLSKVEIRYTPNDSWIEVTTGTYWLDPRTPLDGDPYTHVELTGYGNVMYWPTTKASIRLTGVFGCAAVPTRVARATVALARQIYRADATVPGSIIGPNEWQGGAYPETGRWPDEAWRCVRYYRNRDKCWV